MSLTQKDLDAIENLIGVVVDEKLEKKLNEKLTYFPSKEEFYDLMDKIMKEMENIREDSKMGTGKIYNHEDNHTILII